MFTIRSHTRSCCFLQEFSGAGTRKDDPEKEILDISVTGAVFFIVTASIFLLLLFYFMSSWFVWVLTIFFCIGGMQVTSCRTLRLNLCLILLISLTKCGYCFFQGMHNIITAVLLRYSKFFLNISLLSFFSFLFLVSNS